MLPDYFSKKDSKINANMQLIIHLVFYVVKFKTVKMKFISQITNLGMDLGGLIEMRI